MSLQACKARRPNGQIYNVRGEGGGGWREKDRPHAILDYVQVSWQRSACPEQVGCKAFFRTHWALNQNVNNAPGKSSRSRAVHSERFLLTVLRKKPKPNFFQNILKAEAVGLAPDPLKVDMEFAPFEGPFTLPLPPLPRTTLSTHCLPIS